MTIVIIGAFAFWLTVYALRSLVTWLLYRLELKLYVVLRDRAMERALGKPHGAIAYRRRLDH